MTQRDPGAAPRRTTGRTLPAQPMPAQLVCDQWPALRDRPELVAAADWSLACKRWWQAEDDPRLRQRALSTLLLEPDELAAWLGRRLDPEALLDAHRHVLSMRAAVERAATPRNLVGGFRTGPIWADRRGGAITVFPPPEQVPRLVEELCADHGRLPDHPYVRAAWLAQVLGSIHPFRDGNGATARFLASLELARAWLPPLALSAAQRNRTYMDVLVRAELQRQIDRTVLLVYDVAHLGLAAALFDGGERGDWDAPARVRAETFAERADGCIRGRIGSPLVDQLERLDAADADAQAAVLHRLGRRGHRLPPGAGPRCVTWRLQAPVPVRIDLAVAPVAAAGSWLVAVLLGSLGEDGCLGEVQLGEPMAEVLVAPAGEGDDRAGARFGAWAEARADAIIRGLVQWM